MNQYIHQFEDGEYINLKAIVWISEVSADIDWDTKKPSGKYIFKVFCGSYMVTKTFLKEDDAKKHLFELTEAWKTMLDWEIQRKGEMTKVLKNIHDTLVFNKKIN